MHQWHDIGCTLCYRLGMLCVIHAVGLKVNISCVWLLHLVLFIILPLGPAPGVILDLWIYNSSHLSEGIRWFRCYKVLYIKLVYFTLRYLHFLSEILSQPKWNCIYGWSKAGLCLFIYLKVYTFTWVIYNYLAAPWCVSWYNASFTSYEVFFHLYQGIVLSLRLCDIYWCISRCRS